MNDVDVLRDFIEGAPVMRRCSSACWEKGDCDGSCQDSPGIVRHRDALAAIDSLASRCAELEAALAEADALRHEVWALDFSDEWNQAKARENDSVISMTRPASTWDRVTAALAAYDQARATLAPTVETPPTTEEGET